MEMEKKYSLFKTYKFATYNNYYRNMKQSLNNILYLSIKCYMIVHRACSLISIEINYKTNPTNLHLRSTLTYRQRAM